MRMFMAALVLTSLIAAQSSGSQAAPGMAMPKCASGDRVVMVNTKTKMYHMMTANDKMSKNMMAMCQSKATQMGAHATMNSGSMNSGSMNGGSMNSGSMNSGASNSGSMNGGSMNSGASNSGVSGAGNGGTTLSTPVSGAPSPNSSATAHSN